MHLNITDTWRYTRFYAEPGDNPFASMNELIRHIPASSIANKQVIFECDQEFLDLCTQRDEDGKVLNHDERVEGPTYGGIPLVVKTFEDKPTKPLANHAAGLTDELKKETRGEEKTLTTTSLHHG